MLSAYNCMLFAYTRQFLFFLNCVRAEQCSALRVTQLRRFSVPPLFSTYLSPPPTSPSLLPLPPPARFSRTRRCSTSFPNRKCNLPNWLFLFPTAPSPCQNQPRPPRSQKYFRARKRRRSRSRQVS